MAAKIRKFLRAPAGHNVLAHEQESAYEIMVTHTDREQRFLHIYLFSVGHRTSFIYVIEGSQHETEIVREIAELSKTSITKAVLEERKMLEARGGRIH